MPIKISKAFPRRKSSGNVLGDAQLNQSTDAVEPSFKVFARPQSGHKSLDMNLNTTKPLPRPRANSYEQEDDDMFTVLRSEANNRYLSNFDAERLRPDPNRGSGATDHSVSTLPYGSAASSTRLSSSSTNPSSIDTKSDRNVHASSQASVVDQLPAVPPHQQKPNSFLRTAGCTFSFGVKSKPPETSDIPMPPVPATKGRMSIALGRERAPTESTVSTTVAPRLLESDLTLDTSGLDGFGNMFDGIGAKSREPSPIRMIASPHSMTPAINHPYVASTSTSKSHRVESSPYSFTSDNSRDGLMQTPNSVDTIIHHSPQLTSGRAFGRPLNDNNSSSYMESKVEDNMFADTPSRARAYSRPTNQPPLPPSSFPTPKRQNTSHSTKTASSIQKSPIPENHDAVFDPSLIASAALATKYQEIKPVHVSAAMSNKKVMTPAQFERYRQQQDERHRMNKVFQNRKSDDGESDDNYDDADEDDEAERDRQVANQRRKQEAHLAVYRQTMMKVTGEGPAPTVRSNSGIGGQPTASQSATDLANQFTPVTFDKSVDKSSEPDEDEDVPLGILAAHGFPNKNRPPNRLVSSSSNPNMRGLLPQQQLPGPGSVAGESTKRGSLPVFARHLPEDPYYGASLVNKSNRESMAMHPANNYAPSGAATAHPHHPSGLVGVIAGEERARAMRRGSPNGFDLPPSMQGHPGMARAQTTGSMPSLMVPGMMPGMPPMPGMLSPGDHAQIQMSQQMTQMMQMQMQWMQQMQQMMAQNGGVPSPNQMSPMASMSPMPPNSQLGVNMARPQSVPLQNHPGQDQRTMSMLSPPSLGPWNNGGPNSFNGRPQSSYSPSIAPSERSNVGLASRYRPVSTIQEVEPVWNKRASTMTSSTFRPLSQFGLGMKQPQSSVRKVATVADDEDDEAGWAEMKAKKDQKKKVWKLRKGQNVLQELYN